ncbi:hypothetical protein [Schleiferilactobacillus harbinensis]|uniref:hypothetical protein n=1 Tax=Schleiferilactobacillus harbinensis TaxID=304207 RepID=UPI00116CF3EE|nr:hypothetical protein [Schleiferilactobacillus harbinensis]GEK06154.1 hypothetical protein LHA01_13930 [Schleiferilactobacillus harbinensis]
MAKLSDLIKIDKVMPTITIQGAKIPIHFGFDTLDYVADAYGSSYTIFEHDFNKLMKQKTVQLNHNAIKLINALVYGMVRSGGTETTPEELSRAIGINDIPDIYDAVTKVFLSENFQNSDAEKIKSDPK